MQLKMLLFKILLLCVFLFKNTFENNIDDNDSLFKYVKVLSTNEIQFTNHIRGMHQQNQSEGSVDNNEGPLLKVLIKGTDIKGGNAVKSRYIINTTDSSVSNASMFVTINRARLPVDNFLKEYTFNWISAGLASTDNAVCFMYCSNSAKPDTYWFGSYINDTSSPSWPMEPVINSDQHAMEFTFSKHKIKTLVEHFFINTDGFAVLLDDLHPWYIQRMTYGSPERAHFCFSLKPSKEPYSQDNKKMTHAEKYSTIKFRILMGKDIKKIHQAATGKFLTYIKRPLTFDHLIFESVTWNVEATATIDQKSINDQILLKKYLETFKNFTPKEDKKLLMFYQYWHPYNIFQFNENIFPHDIVTFITSLTNQNVFLCLTVPPLLDYKVNVHQNDIIISESIQKEAYLKTMSNLSNFKVPSFVLDEQTNLYVKMKNENLLIKYPTLQKTISLETMYKDAGQRSLITPYVSKSTRLATPVRLPVNYANNKLENLPVLLKHMLTLSMAGYSLVIPEINDVSKLDLPNYLDFLKFLQVAIFSPGGLSLTVPYWGSWFTKEQQQIIKNLLKIHRENLLPLKMKLAQSWLETGEPIIRPMWYAAPDDPKSWPVTDQFMLGPDIVALPVFKDTKEKRIVYLPSGKWLLYVNGKPSNFICDIPKQMQKCFSQYLNNLKPDKVYYLIQLVT